LRFKRLIFVVQRYFAGVVGGSERLAGLWAALLQEACSVEIWTSCARETDKWANAFPAGYSDQGPIPVRRFPVSQERDESWESLHRQLVRDFNGWRREPQTILADSLDWSYPCRLERWPLALQMEWLRRQGPWTPSLWDALLEERQSQETAYVLTPYLYATTVISALLLPRGRTFIVPALHDEAPAYLPLIRESLGAHRLLFLTRAERSLGLEFWPGASESAVIGLPVEAYDGQPFQAPQPYVLYAGRMDPAKGVPSLVQAFAGSDGHLALYLIGSAPPEGRSYPAWIKHLGIVTDTERKRLIRGAVAVAVPSLHESFSLIAIEAMAMGTVVLVNGKSSVLCEHVREGGGIACYSPDEYLKAGTSLLDAKKRQEMSIKARSYASRFAPDQVKGRLIQSIFGTH